MVGKKPIPPPFFRAASATDAASLAAFSCARTEWEREAETFIQDAALCCHLDQPPDGRYPHTMIVAEGDDKAIIGLAAYRRGPIQLFNQSQITGIVFVVLAVATNAWGLSIVGDGKLSHALAYELARHAGRGRRSSEPVYGIVDFRNKHSIRLLETLGFQPVPFGAVGSLHGVYATQLDKLFGPARIARLSG